MPEDRTHTKWVMEEIETEKCLERWAWKCTNHFTKKMKRLLYEKIDNNAWNGNEKEVARLCKRNKVFDEITEEEIQELWNQERPDKETTVRLNGKYVWEAAKRECDFIYTHDDFIQIATIVEYR